MKISSCPLIQNASLCVLIKVFDYDWKEDDCTIQ